MNKTFKILITTAFFIVLAFGIYVFFIPETKNITSDIFLIKDTTEIAKVLIKQDSEKVILSRINSGKSWIVDGKYPANKKAVRKLYQTLTEAKINKPILSVEKDSILNFITSKGKLIQIYNFENELIKELFVGRYNKQSEGTYMLNVQNNIPFIVNIPGVENDLNYRYNINPVYWLKPEIFSYKPNEIKEIILKYPNNKAKSFKIEIIADTAKVFDFKNKKFVKNINLNKIGSYLSYFMNVKFASETSDTEKLRYELLNQNFFAEISVKNINNKIKIVKLYRIKNNNTDEGFDLNKMYALINNRDVVTVKYVDFDLILKDITYFVN